MREVRREVRNDEPGAAYCQLIADFLTVHAAKDEREGYPAFEGELLADGAGMLAERKLLVFLRAVLFEWSADSGVKAEPSLRFVVCKDGHAPEAFLDSFAVETELVLEALENIDPSAGDLQISIPAVEVRDHDVDGVVAGNPLYLRISYTRIEPVPGKYERRLPAPGLRFAVGGAEQERKHPLAYSFAMAGLTPFLALDAAMVQYSGPPSSVLELEELRQEIERTPEG
jgi:hypothetical protein